MHSLAGNLAVALTIGVASAFADTSNLVDIDISSSDNGKSLGGTITYSTEGPIGFLGVLRDKNAGSNYSTVNQWGGDQSPWDDGGRWVIGARGGEQDVVAMKVSSDDDGRTLSGTMTYDGEGPVGLKGLRNNGSVYEVKNAWENSTGNDGGVWLLGSRGDIRQHIVALDITSSDDGMSFTGTITYAGEGPIGFKAVHTKGNSYAVENEFGGEWHPAGQWLIGGRNQKVTSLQISSSDDGQSLEGTMAYQGEGAIGVSATLVGGRGYEIENQWGGEGAPWNPGGVWILGNRMTFQEDVKEEDNIVDKLTKGPVDFPQDSLPFIYGTTDLASPSASLQLDELANAMNSSQLGDMRFKIEGHTCDKGSDSHNQSLSERRAKAIAAALGARGVEAGRLDVVGYGESRPAVPNTTPENRARNRRVVVSREGMDTSPGSAGDSGVTTPEKGSQLRKSICDAFRVPMGKEVNGQDIVFVIHQLNVMGDWAFINCSLQLANGKEVDWRKTNFKSDAEAGELENAAAGLLKKTPGGEWSVVEHSFNHTDVVWAAWGDKHGVSQKLFQ